MVKYKTKKEEGEEMTYEKSFKEEAVRLSEEIGVKKAAEQLGIPYNTLSDWRQKQKRHGSQAHVGSGHKRMPDDPKEQEICELRKENAELRRSNGILQEALFFLQRTERGKGTAAVRVRGEEPGQPVHQRCLPPDAGDDGPRPEPQRCGA